MSGERITLVMDSDVLKKLREIQSKRIAYETKSVSFSRVVNEELRYHLKIKIGSRK